LDDGRVLGQRVPDGAINGGQLDLLGPGPLVGVADGAALAAWLDETFGAGSLRVGAVVDEVRHGITHHRIRLAVHEAQWRGRLRAPLVVAPADAPWTTLARKGTARTARPAG
jgi:hypothetical protein